MNNIPLLYCLKLTKNYQHSHRCVKVLNNINLCIQAHEIIAVVGESGSGKSTLLHLLGGLDKPTTGDIFFEGNLLNKLSERQFSIFRNQHLGFIYQFHHLLSDFNILENVTIPLLIKGMRYCFAKKKAKKILQLVGLEKRIYHYSYELSGGESQRVAIARAIINNPTLILADEPTGNLDQKNSYNIFQVLKKLNLNYGTTFLIATHDQNIIQQCHKIFTLSDGKIRFNIK